MDVLKTVKDYERIHEIAVMLAIRELYGDYPTDSNISTVPDSDTESIIVVFSYEDSCSDHVHISFSDIQYTLDNI